MANRLKEYCSAIQAHEGYGTPNAKTITTGKNPCALRWSKYQLGVRNGFSYFASYQDGFNACVFDVQSKCLGRTKTGLGPESTILDFAEVWAPSWDNNKPHIYAEFLASRLNLSIYATLKEIYAESLTQKILAVIDTPFDREDIVKDAFYKVQSFFNILGADTQIDFVSVKALPLPVVVIKGTTGEDLSVIKDISVLDPAKVKEKIGQYINGHQFTIFAYKWFVGNTPTEFSEIYKGSVIGQIPVLDVSDSDYLAEFICHEILHGWYHRLNAETLLSLDRVHSYSWGPGEKNYSVLVKDIMPFFPLIMRPIKDKPFVPLLEILPGETREGALERFIRFLAELLTSWSRQSR